MKMAINQRRGVRNPFASSGGGRISHGGPRTGGALPTHHSGGGFRYAGGSQGGHRLRNLCLILTFGGIALYMIMGGTDTTGDGSSGELRNKMRQDALRLSQRSERMGLSKGVEDLSDSKDKKLDAESPLKNDDVVSNRRKKDTIIDDKHHASRSKNGPVEDSTTPKKKMETQSADGGEEHLMPLDNAKTADKIKESKQATKKSQEDEKPKTPPKEGSKADLPETKKTQVKGEGSKATVEGDKGSKTKADEKQTKVEGAKSKATAEDDDKTTTGEKKTKVEGGKSKDTEEGVKKTKDTTKEEDAANVPGDPLIQKVLETAAKQNMTSTLDPALNKKATTDDETTKTDSTGAKKDGNKSKAAADTKDEKNQLELWQNSTELLLHGPANVNDTEPWKEEAVDENFQPIKGSKGEAEEAAKELKQAKKGSKSIKDDLEGKVEMEMEGLEPLNNIKGEVSEDDKDDKDKDNGKDKKKAKDKLDTADDDKIDLDNTNKTVDKNKDKDKKTEKDKTSDGVATKAKKDSATKETPTSPKASPTTKNTTGVKTGDVKNGSKAETTGKQDAEAKVKNSKDSLLEEKREML